jgi:hypothetical protein
MIVAVRICRTMVSPSTDRRKPASLCWNQHNARCATGERAGERLTAGGSVYWDEFLESVPARDQMAISVALIDGMLAAQRAIAATAGGRVEDVLSALTAAQRALADAESRIRSRTDRDDTP